MQLTVEIKVSFIAGPPCQLPTSTSRAHPARLAFQLQKLHVYMPEGGKFLGIALGNRERDIKVLIIIFKHILLCLTYTVLVLDKHYGS